MSDNIEEQMEVIIEGEEETPQEEEKVIEEKTPPSIVTKEDLDSIRAETEGLSRTVAESITTSVDRLAEKLTTPGEKPPPSEEELIAKDKEFYKTPTSSAKEVADKLFDKKIAPIAQQFILNSQATARELAFVKKDTSDIMERYADEVEAAVNQMPLDQRVHPEAYSIACKAVKGLHSDELAEEKATELFEKWKEEEMKKNPTFAGKSDNTPPAPKKVVKRFTKEEFSKYRAGLDEDVIKEFVTPERDRR